MRRLLTWVLLCVFLAATACSTSKVFAQQVEAGQQQKAAQFDRLVERVKQARDAEERIALADEALKLEPELGQWPLSFPPREDARAYLWAELGNGYLNRTQGGKAENIERAIAAIEHALPILTREKSPNDWASLQNMLATAYRRRIHGDPADNLEKAISALEADLTTTTRDTHPREWATTQYDLANSYHTRLRGNRPDNLEKAIAAYGAALTVFTREALPRKWAQTHNDLGAAYRERIRGEPAANLEKAIEHYELALTVRTREALPRQWADTQNNLAVAYVVRIHGERADNVEKAIAAYEAALSITTREALPLQWADTQSNLGLAYQERVRGEPAANLEKAIGYLEAALTVRTREVLPREWAATQNNLAMAYRNRIRGERADNLERGIAAAEAALTVRTRSDVPLDWAQTQRVLASYYAERIRGDSAENLEKAIAAYEAVLTVLTREDLPRLWAQTQNDLAVAYRDRIRGERAGNLEKAIAAYQAALEVRTREALPREWADTQNNLAVAYVDRIRGDRANNLEKAIAAYEAALTVTTREAFPRKWAQIQTNLGGVYRDRIHGDRVDNVEKAIAAYEAALTVLTREAVPRDHLVAGQLLGSTLLATRRWREAGLALASAREAFLSLFGQGLNDAEARNLIAYAGQLFAEAGFAAAQRGENEEALALISEGRARLMAVALRLATDARPRVLELRAAIRIAERNVEAAQGAERAAAVERVVSLRQELLGLVRETAAAESSPRTVLAHARALVAEGGVVAVPIVTSFGGKLLIVSKGVRSLGSDTVPQQRNGGAKVPQKGGGAKLSDPLGLTAQITVLDLPELTTDKLNTLLRGDAKAEKQGGWLGAYPASNLPELELRRRERAWPAALATFVPELWPLFAGKLDTALKELGLRPGERLFWLPSGALGILPLGAAQNPVNSRRLADDYEIVYAASLHALVTSQKQVAKVAPATLAAIINPTEDLEGTEQEGRLVASHFPKKARTVLERGAATPDAALAALKGKTYWHFASHGTFSWDDARQSALVMHGRAHLSVGRLVETDGLGRPRLVVLSACETGLYDISRNPDEFIGLPGTFTALGAAGVLGTLWPVDDHATWLLIAKFYEFHMSAKLPPPTALAQAQAWLRAAASADLAAYAKAAAKQGRLESRHGAEIEHALTEDGLGRSRNAALIEWTVPEATTETRTSQPASAKKKAGTTKRIARPYAHPYFWAGFIYTGL